CFDHTGMTELGPTGVSCSQRDGIHLIESEFIFEVLDADGHPSVEGELVATNLGRWGMPLIRYRTGDRVKVSREQCSCGSAFLKLLGGIQGRVDDMLTVRGVNLFPSQGGHRAPISGSRRVRHRASTRAAHGRGLAVDR